MPFNFTSTRFLFYKLRFESSELRVVNELQATRYTLRVQSTSYELQGTDFERVCRYLILILIHILILSVQGTDFERVCRYLARFNGYLFRYSGLVLSTAFVWGPQHAMRGMRSAVAAAGAALSV